ncbi:hypothetical protein P175DRAFT_0498411 [Aspergillus ochraceoroseus IBT 24754]|uniref:Uncharacterized protein n=1 Tax=Aspergillus ochraceoroseus IBT 24754 TaxID=1392256 RepID=A0A2T5M9S8_9EURO|nr:uncharacterized protein P175DRAFT_0498411 [Aspergillus ochraceoroseus IBT 24754]PTU25293.1 hypothetical protein P175DRAFT_0498411 [Aspergillus ochraceoroseus IBT 24754]
MLLEFTPQIYPLIAENPIAWATLATRIRSAPIFQEAAVHVIGKWSLLEETERASLPQKARELWMP